MLGQTLGYLDSPHVLTIWAWLVVTTVAVTAPPFVLQLLQLSTLLDCHQGFIDFGQERQLLVFWNAFAPVFESKICS